MHMFVITKLRKWGQEGQEEFNASICYKSKFEKSLGYMRPWLKNKSKTTFQLARKIDCTAAARAPQVVLCAPRALLQNFPINEM